MNILSEKHVKQPKKEVYMFRKVDKYGYFTNLRHPQIANEYRLFKTKRKIPEWCPLSDDERNEFDGEMLKKFIKQWNEWKMQLYSVGGALYGERDSIISEAYGCENLQADTSQEQLYNSIAI